MPVRGCRRFLGLQLHLLEDQNSISGDIEKNIACTFERAEPVQVGQRRVHDAGLLGGFGDGGGQFLGGLAQGGEKPPPWPDRSERAGPP